MYTFCCIIQATDTVLVAKISGLSSPSCVCFSMKIIHISIGSHSMGVASDGNIQVGLQPPQPALTCTIVNASRCSHNATLVL